MYGHTLKITVAVLLIATTAQAKMPEWATKNSTKLSGSVLTTVCNGTGPSLDIARADAIKSCQVSASQYFNTKIKIKALSVESEKSVGFHQEISSEDEIENLICEPLKDQTEEIDSQFKIWIECRFDLNKITTKPVEQPYAPSENKNLHTLEHAQIVKTADQKDKIIFISTVPKCESLIVRGATPRTISCNNNPIKVRINSADEEIIVRAKDYKPKTINVKGVKSDETFQVLLDLL